MTQGTAPSVVYRFLNEEDHARQLCEGQVYLSTFSHIRSCDQARADAEEGKTVFHTADAEWINGVPQNEAARNVEATGWHNVMPPARYASMANNRIHMIVPDALVLCFSTSPGDDKFRRVFGQHRVSLTKLVEFYYAVTRAVAVALPIREHGVFELMYVGRHIDAATSANLHPARVGPEVNAWEREVRMIWLPAGPAQLSPIVLHVPEVAGMCASA